MLACLFSTMGVIGMSGAQHRLWSHKSYKARLPFKILLMQCATMNLQFPIHNWALGHRVHHKYSDTDADPHNNLRGLWYAQIGWTVQKAHPLVAIKSAACDTSDLQADLVVAFQRAYYIPCFILFGLLIPISSGMVIYGTTLWTAYLLHCIVPGFYAYHCCSFVNTAAHLFGHKPYNHRIHAVETMATNLGVLGEGYHNYHHNFPVDYAAGELSNRLNVTKWLIDFMALIGLAYDLKTTQPRVIARAKERVIEKGRFKVLPMGY